MSEYEDNEFCCDFYLQSTRIKDYDGYYIQYWCPICKAEWTEKEDED